MHDSIPSEVVFLTTLAVVFLIFGSIGYMLNITKLVRAMRTPASTQEVMIRVTGVFVPFIGAFAGYI